MAGAAIPHPSPNFGERRDGARVDLVVIHYTAIPCDDALARLCDPGPEVSAHYLIAADGRLFHLVDEGARAWHAGAGTWGGRGDVNSRSIGIELDNSGQTPFAARQMDRLELLLSDVLARFGLPPEAVIGHADLAPARKVDPGARFDWRRLARQGLSVWPEGVPTAPDEAGFVAALTAFGYPAANPDTLLAAFRLRFFPRATGPLTAAEMGAARDLARRFPVDRDAADA